jgi:hypothetical protein
MRGHGTVGVQSQHGDLRQPHYERCITLLIIISYSKTFMVPLTVLDRARASQPVPRSRFENPCHHTAIDSLQQNGRETHARRQRELLSVRPIRATSCTRAEIARSGDHDGGDDFNVRHAVPTRRAPRPCRRHAILKVRASGDSRGFLPLPHRQVAVRG